MEHENTRSRRDSSEEKKGHDSKTLVSPLKFSFSKGHRLFRSSPNITLLPLPARKEHSPTKTPPKETDKVTPRKMSRKASKNESPPVSIPIAKPTDQSLTVDSKNRLSNLRSRSSSPSETPSPKVKHPEKTKKNERRKPILPGIKRSGSIEHAMSDLGAKSFFHISPKNSTPDRSFEHATPGTPITSSRDSVRTTNTTTSPVSTPRNDSPSPDTETESTSVSVSEESIEKKRISYAKPRNRLEQRKNGSKFEFKLGIHHEIESGDDESYDMFPKSERNARTSERNSSASRSSKITSGGGPVSDPVVDQPTPEQWKKGHRANRSRSKSLGSMTDSDEVTGKLIQKNPENLQRQQSNKDKKVGKKELKEKNLSYGMKVKKKKFSWLLKKSKRKTDPLRSLKLPLGELNGGIWLKELIQAVEPKDFKEVFTKGDVLATGGFGTVYKATHQKEHATYIVKEIKFEMLNTAVRNLHMEQLLLRELLVLKMADHPNLVKLHSSFLSLDVIYVVCEYCELGSLSSLFWSNKMILNEEQVKLVTFSVLQALNFLHSHGIIHRDIKGANIFLTANGQVKLGDFGTCALITNNIRRNSFLGTPHFMAPEIINCKNKINQYYDFSADVWSLGIVIIECCEGFPPLSDLSDIHVMKLIPKFVPSLKNPELWSPELLEVIHGCLKLDPSERKSIPHLLDLPFFEGVDEDCLKPICCKPSVPKESTHQSLWNSWSWDAEATLRNTFKIEHTLRNHATELSTNNTNINTFWNNFSWDANDPVQLVSKLTNNMNQSQIMETVNEPVPHLKKVLSAEVQEVLYKYNKERLGILSNTKMVTKKAVEEMNMRIKDINSKYEKDIQKEFTKLEEFTAVAAETYKQNLSKWDEEYLLDMVTDPLKHSEAAKHVEKLKFAEDNLFIIKAKYQSFTEGLAGIKKAQLKDVQTAENEIHSIITSIERRDILEIHRTQQAQVKELNAIELRHSEESWALKRKLLAKCFSANPALAKKIPEMHEYIQTRQQQEKVEFDKDQIEQKKWSEENEEEEKKKMAELRNGTLARLFQIHGDENRELENRMEVDLIGISYLFKKILCLLKYGGFLSFGENVEDKLDILLKEEQDKIKDKFPNEQEIAIRNNEKNEIFNSLLDKVFAFSEDLK